MARTIDEANRPGSQQKPGLRKIEPYSICALSEVLSKFSSVVYTKNEEPSPSHWSNGANNAKFCTPIILAIIQKGIDIVHNKDIIRQK